jgi:hypothetical protein
MINQDMFNHLFNATSPFWVSYCDEGGRQIGHRDLIPSGFKLFQSNGGFTFPPSSCARNGVASILVIDTPEGDGNVYLKCFTGGGFVDRILDLHKGDFIHYSQ